MKKHLLISLAIICFALSLKAEEMQGDDHNMNSKDWIVEFQQSEVVITIGETIIVPVRFSPVEPEEYKLFWATLNPSVAEVNGSGEITGIGPGRTTIEVYPEGSTALERGSTLLVTVKDSDHNRICLTIDDGGYYYLEGAEVVPARPGFFYNIKATLNGMDITSESEWLSSDESVATVTSKGKVTIKDIGEAVVSVKYSSDGKEYEAGLKFISRTTFNPVVNQVTDVTESGFSISWDPIVLAAFYSVNVKYYDGALDRFTTFENFQTPATSAHISVNPDKSKKYSVTISAVRTTPWDNIELGESEPTIVEINNSGVDKVLLNLDYSAPYEVYSLDGRLAGLSLEQLQNGIYIVRQNGNVVKIVKSN